MGNSWRNCPSNINDLVERSGFSHCFSPLVPLVTAALRDFPQEKNQRGKEEVGRGEKRAKKGKEKARRVYRCSIFSFEGPEAG